MATGYCMKCKAQREIKNPKQITMKNGRPATEGACPVCSTKIFKIGAGKSTPRPSQAQDDGIRTGAAATSASVLAQRQLLLSASSAPRRQVASARTPSGSPSAHSACGG